MPPRIHVDSPLAAGLNLSLPAGAARHVQVLRLQPGAPLTLFDGHGGEWSATVARMGRSEVDVDVGTHDPVDREAAVAVTIALGMPANERMDALVEKATELGVAVIQPLICERSVLRLSGERAQKKIDHWRGVAIAASEQSGRTRVPEIAPVRSLAQWLGDMAPADETDGSAGPHRWVLSLRDAVHVGQRMSGLLNVAASRPALVLLSGPEGGLAPAEEALARSAGFQPVGLGPRVLRADTAPIAVLAHVGLSASGA